MVKQVKHKHCYDMCDENGRPLYCWVVDESEGQIIIEELVPMTDNLPETLVLPTFGSNQVVFDNKFFEFVYHPESKYYANSSLTREQFDDMFKDYLQGSIIIGYHCFDGVKNMKQVKVKVPSDCSLSFPSFSISDAQCMSKVTFILPKDMGLFAAYYTFDEFDYDDNEPGRMLKAKVTWPLIANKLLKKYFCYKTNIDAEENVYGVHEYLNESRILPKVRIEYECDGCENEV